MKKGILIIYLLLLFSESFSYADSNLFYPYVYFPLNSYYSQTMAVAIGDVNGDGRNDVVMTTSCTSSDPENGCKIHVFLQDQFGLIDGPSIKYLITSDNWHKSIDIGDINHDGRADVVIGSLGSNIQVFLQNDSGGLDPGVSYPTGNSSSIRIADLNNDGLLDVVGIGTQNTVYVLFQNSNGTLNPPVIYAVTHGGYYDEVEVGDVNNDGLTDIIVISGAGTTDIAILLQNPDGTFAGPTYYHLDVREQVQGGAIADINGDGLNDIVVAYGWSGPNSGIGVFLQNSTGTLNPAISYASYTGPDSVAIGDVDGDGREDVIVVHYGSEKLGVYLQDTNGKLLPEELYPIYSASGNPRGVAIRDINDDGFNDVVVAGTSGLVVLYNKNGPAIPNLSVSPASLNFGSVFLGDNSSQTITVYNRGTGDLIIDAINISGVNGNEFSQTNDCSTVGPGASCYITSTFTPTAEGTKDAVLAISSNDSHTPTVQIMVFAYAGPKLFHPRISFQVGRTMAEAVAIGDVNGDGRNDVVMTTGSYDDPENDYKIHVFLQNQFGQLDPQIKYPTNSSYTNRSTSIDIGDVNNDGKADVVVGNCGSNIEVFIQNASGGLNPGVSYPTANSCSIKIADLNNDGLLDVVGIGKGTNTADIFFQNFSGTLSPPVTYAVVHGPNYDEVDIGDLNNDGLTDIIIMSDRGFGILLQRSGGSFDPAVYYDLGGNETVQGIAIGDVNGDNLQDIVVSYGGDSGIGIFLQNISGPLDPVVKYRSYGGSTVIADVNNDGKKDIIISGGAIGIHLQGPGGMILPVESYPLPGSASSNPQRLSVGDINGDGFNDVVLADYNTGLVVLYNIRGPAIPNIDVFPSSVNFGSVFLGHSGSRDITIYNRGTGGLTISAIGITGPDAAAFSQTNTCSTVGPGSTCTVTVTFDATTEGEKNAILIITSNDPGTPLVEVTFFGYVPGPAIPNISISRSSVDFGSVLLRNTSSPPQYIIIYNTGTGDLIVNSISITGENASEFNQTNNCSTVWPGGYCEINATLTPVSEGTKSATLTISSNDPVNPLVQVTFSAHAGPPLFHPYVSLYTGSLQEAVAIGDVNGDGRNDVVMTTSFYSDPDNDYRIFVFLQDSSGQLQPPIRYPTNSSYSRGPISIDIGDVNHDGRADVVVGNCGSNIEVFIQNASGGLNPGVSYPTVNSCSIKIADLNNDGLLDVVGIGNTNTVDIFLQNSNGTLDQPVTYSVIHEGPDNQEVEVGDVNNDGLMDIIVMSEHGMAHNIGVLLQQNNGTFGEPAYYYLDGNKLTGGVAVGDVNGDNLQDIVVSATWPSSRIGVFLQNSAGALNPATSYQSHLDPEPIVIADMNADGKKDVIVVHHGYERLGIYLQGSDGSLLPEQLYVLPYGYCSNPQGLAVGDVNGDGFNDVVIVNHGYGLVVLYGRKQEPAISVSPVSLNFNPTYLGYTSAQTLTISNEGTKNLNVATIVLSGSNASEFKIDYDNCSERTLLTLDSCTVSVFFAPESPGVKDAVLTVNSNDPGEPNLLVSVSGTAVLGPDIRQPISPIGFGDVNVGRLLDGTTTIFNDGDNTLFVAITRSSGSADFSYIGSWFTIPAGGSQTVTVRFSPSSPGAKEATFIVISNDPDENGAPFTVSGTGVPVPDIRQPISSVEFSGVNVGSLLDRTTAIFNDGTDTLTISKITRDSGSTAFVYIAPATPFNIPAGGSQTITVRFSPASRGAQSATFTVNSNDPDESSVSFTASGTGVTIPDIRQPVVSINFDDVNAGVSIDQTTTLYNDGLGILTINSITRASGSTAFVYIAPATPFTIPAGGSRTITVRFSPTSGGAKSATFNVNSNDPDEGNVSFSVSGTGVVSVQPFPFFDDFSTNKGWIGYEPGGWKRGPASAGSVESGNPDPAADHTQTGDNYLLGYNIGGGYPNNLLEEKAIISPAIDCAGQSAVFLKFWRYLNVQSNFYDHAKIYVSNDGENWTELWENPVFDLTDNQWRQVVFDISSIAANQPTVYINFSMGPTDSSLRFSGWNIDDLEVTSDYSGPMALYVHTDDTHNSNVDEMLIQAGLSIKHFDAIPSNLSDYDLLIVSDEGVCNSTTANSIKAFVQNGAGAIIMNGTPYPLAGNTTDLSSIRDWFGAGSYGNDGGYATVAAPNPFGTALLIDEKVYYSAPNSAAAVYDLAPEANLVSKWSSNGAHSFSYRVGQGRVFYYAGNPGYSEDPNPVIMENSLILFEAGLLWASGCTVPMITTQPQSQTIQSGQKATMSVSASGTPPLSYQWYQGATGNTSTPVGANSNIYTTPALTQTASYWVRVINACGSVDSNTATVTVATAGIAVVSPNGGETWPAGSTQTIRWNYTGNPGLYMKIELFKGGVVNRTIKSFVWKGTGGSGSFNWMVPVNQAPGADYRIRVTSTTYGGCTYTSDSDFTIAAPTITVVSPNEGETWAAGSVQTIRWTYTGNPGPYVKIELLQGGVVNRTIATSGKGIGGSGSHNWRIPAKQAPGADYRIRVTSTNNNSCSDTSDSNLTISK